MIKSIIILILVINIVYVKSCGFFCFDDRNYDVSCSEALQCCENCVNGGGYCAQYQYYCVPNPPDHFRPTPFGCPYITGNFKNVERLRIKYGFMIKMNLEFSERIQGIMPGYNTPKGSDLTFVYLSMEESLWFNEFEWSHYKLNCQDKTKISMTRENGVEFNQDPDRVVFSAGCSGNYQIGTSDTNDYMGNMNYCTNRDDDYEITYHNGVRIKTHSRNNVLDEITAISISTFPIKRLINFDYQVIGRYLFIGYDGAPELPIIKRITSNSMINKVFKLLIIFGVISMIYIYLNI